MMKKYNTNLKTGASGDVAYISLDQHPGKGSVGCVKKTVSLNSLLQYKAPDINLDFDEDNNLIGIEVLYF